MALQTTAEPRGLARRRSQRLPILCASIAGHALLLGLMFSSASGALMSSGQMSGGFEGPVFAVAMVSSSDLQRASQETRLSALQSRLAPTEIDALYVTDSEDGQLGALARRLNPGTENLRQEAERPPAGSVVSADQDRRAAEAGGRLENSKSADGDGEGASTGALWGRIAPCWRDLGTRSSVAVRLEIALDSTGRLKAPPRILRTANARLDDLRLRAEERALAALAACMPHNDVQFGGKTYELEFPALAR